MVAWLITMVPSPVEHVIATLNYRLSYRSVGVIMERLYVERREGLSRLIEYTKSGKTNHPWKLSIVDGIPCSDELWCGSGDCIFWARKVDNLKVIKDENDSDKLVWTERKRPDLTEVCKVLDLPNLKKQAS